MKTKTGIIIVKILLFAYVTIWNHAYLRSFVKIAIGLILQIFSWLTIFCQVTLMDEVATYAKAI